MFRFRNLSIAAFLCFAPWAQASTVAIIDSGVDIKHPDLAGKIWKNSADSLNFKDDDGNGFVDDINGWNFFANSNELIDLQYESLFSSDIDQFFTVQEKFLLGTATDEDIAWVQAKVQDANFVASINKYGTFVHGTHVAGIASKDNANAKVMTIRLIPVENPLAQLKKDIVRANQTHRELSGFKKILLKAGLVVLAKAQGTAFGTVGQYIGEEAADVANASLGAGIVQARLIITPLVKLAGGLETDTALIDELAVYFLNQAVTAQKKIATVAPKTLFVFASGNDGTNNDLYPVSPANAGLSNTMSVGASINYRGIAPFSNFGKTTVDLLAPGVGIVSSVPGNRHMALSGTSQAAPFVAGIAVGVKDANPSLTAAQIKTIIMGTVDVKAELADKVVTSGIANRDRALAAAALSTSVSIADAIAEARTTVADQEVTVDLINVDQVIPVAVGSPIVSGM